MTRIANPELFKERILVHLRLNTDVNHPKVSRQLQALWDISDLTVRQAVGLLRDDGEPIASGARGFFYATSPEQLDATVDDLEKRIAVISRRRHCLISAQNKMREITGGQRLLFTNLHE
jgi:hypothetical protein